MTHKKDVARRLALSYGVYPLEVTDVENTHQALIKANAVVKERNIAQKGERLVLTAGVPFGTPGSTNLLRVSWVD